MKPNIPGLFHAITGPTSQERQAGHIKEFVGDGTAHLPVPGLKELVSLQVGRTPIPLERDYQFPQNNNFQQKITITLPHAAVVLNHDGTPILMRSIHSNDGIWQKGEKVFVGGEWEDEITTPKADDTKTDDTKTDEVKPDQVKPDESLAPIVKDILKLSVEDIRKQAIEKGVEGAETMKKQDLAVALAKAAGYVTD